MGKSGDSKDRSGARWDGRHRSGISKGYTSGSGSASLWANIAEKSVMAWCCYPRRQSRGAVDRLRLDGGASPPCLSRGASLQILKFYIYLNLTSPFLMPPKKKTKVPSRAAPTDADSPLPEFDGWTDEQETTLFKAISVYRLKPAGESTKQQF